MVIPGDTLGVCEVTPALFATVAANEAERAAPGVTLVDVSMIGVAGRIYLAGQTADVTRAQQAMADVLATVEGRDQSGGGRDARGRDKQSAGAGKTERGSPCPRMTCPPAATCWTGSPAARSGRSASTAATPAPRSG